MRPENRRVLMDGLAVGVIGYLIVALFFALLNVLEGRSPFYTAAMLGEVLFAGRRDPAGLEVAPPAVFAFNGVYLVLFVALGVILSLIVRLGERMQQFWYVVAVAWLFVALHFLAATAVLPPAVRAAVPLWAAVVSSILVAFAAGLYFLKTHPALRKGAREFDDDGVRP